MSRHPFAPGVIDVQRRPRHSLRRELLQWAKWSLLWFAVVCIAGLAVGLIARGL